MIWGSTWMAIRIVVAHMPPLRSVSFRFLLASAVLLPILAFRRSRLPQGREWLLLSLVGTLMMALPFSITAWAEQWIPSGKTSLLFATSPLITGWMETWLGRGPDRRRLPPVAVIGMLLALAGVILLFYRTASITPGEGRGAVAIAAVVLLGSATAIAAKQWLRAVPLLTLVATETLFAGLVLGCASLLLEAGRPQTWTPSAIAAMLFLGLVSSALGFLLYFWLLMRIEPFQLAARYFIMPIVALSEGAVLLHEPLSWNISAGAFAVLAGLVLVLPSRATPLADTPAPATPRP